MQLRLLGIDAALPLLLPVGACHTEPSFADATSSSWLGNEERSCSECLWRQSAFLIMTVSTG